MKFKIRNELLAPALKRAYGVSKNKTTLAVLSDVLLVAESSKLTVHATDLDNTISIEFSDCEIEENGKLLLNAEKMYRLTSKIDSDAVVEISSDSCWAEVKAGSLDCRVMGSAPEDFPNIPGSDPEQMLVVSVDRLTEMISKTAFCVSSDESRANLTGINVKVQDSELTMESTDGHRMSLVERKADESDELDDAGAKLSRHEGVIVPAKAMEQLKAAVKDEDGSVSFGVDDTSIVFKFSNTILTSRLINGTFPDFTQVLPPFDYANSALIQKDAMLDALKVVGIFTNTKTGRMTMRLEKDKLLLDAQDADAGRGSEEVVVNYNSDDAGCNFNYRYILDALGAIDGDEVEMMIGGKQKPTLIKDQADDGATFVIMPLR